MRIYWLDKYNGGKLGMMARPKGGDWLEDEIYKLKKNQVSTLVSLLEREEGYELELGTEKQICNAVEIEFINFPIKDRDTPENFETFKNLVDTIKERLFSHTNVVIHCRMGIGRTALLAATTLINEFDSVNDIFDHLAEVRTLSVPDTQEQINWVKSYKDKFQNNI